jgi:hypothetical protein
MRIGRRPKPSDPADSERGEAKRKESPDHFESSIGDPPSWATRIPPKGVERVPSHAVRPAVEERRGAARAKLSLPIRVKRVAGQRERKAQTLRTMNISSSGVLFLSPHRIEPGTPIELEVRLVDRPFGRGNVKMMTEAHIVRADPAPREGWHALAATFDEITFQRDEPSPKWFGRE